jgi:hypothetical protein
MQAVSTSKKSVNFYETTRRNVQEASDLNTRRQGNLKVLYAFIYRRIPILYMAVSACVRVLCATDQALGHDAANRNVPFYKFCCH